MTLHLDEFPNGVALPDDDDQVPADLALPDAALRGSFTDVIEYLKPVTGANRAHVFGSWLAVLGASIGYRRWGRWSGRVVPVFYVVNIGTTGDHKSSASEGVLDLVSPDEVALVDGVTSDAGLFDRMEAAEGKSALLHFDEIGFLLKMAAMPGSTLDSVFNRLWSFPKFLDRNLSRRNKDGGGIRRIDHPFVSMLAATHPETFWRTIGDPHLAISSGFVNRLAVFLVEDARSLAITAEPDDRAAQGLRDHLRRFALLEPRTVELSSSGRDLWVEFSNDHERQIQGLPVEQAAVTKRVRDHVARLALVYAVDAGRLEITLDDLVAAIEVGAFIEAGFHQLLLGRQADRGPARTADIERIALRILTAHRSTFYSVRDLQQAWPNHNRPAARELRSALAAMDRLEVEPPRGTRKERYRVPSPTPSYPKPRHASARNSTASSVGLSGIDGAVDA